MFDKLKKLIEQAKIKATASVDPAVFNHPVAQKTEWHPLKGGGTNFQTHRLDSSNPDKLVFSATLGAKMFSGLFAVIGLFGMVIPAVIFFTGGMKEGALLMFALLFGGTFFGVGMFMLYLFALPRVFDTFYGCYYKGWKRPQHTIQMSQNKKHAITHLNEVEAIQVLRERINSKNGSYHSYEINLVLNDASRVNVIDHGNHQAIIEDAETLARILGVPFWDGS